MICLNLILFCCSTTCELDESGAILNFINNNLTKQEIVMSLTLEERQPRTDMEITSVDYGETEAVITAEGNMGEYGRVYASYHLSYNADRSGGTYTAQGRGFIDYDTMASGAAVGVWRREGSLIHMDELVNINDGTQNLGKIVIDPIKRTMIMDVYVIS
jgi:hypothetical protein